VTLDIARERSDHQRMRNLIVLVVMLAAVGCKKKEGEGAKSSTPCGAAVDRGVDQTISKRRGPNAAPMTPEEAEVPKKLKVALEKACTDTKWSTAVLECFNTAPDIATCKEQLTPEQRGAYTQAAMSVMAGARGNMPHGMAPPPGGSAAPPSGETPPPPAIDGSASPVGSAAGSN
jgi:hypothetical protein